MTKSDPYLADIGLLSLGVDVRSRERLGDISWVWTPCSACQSATCFSVEAVYVRRRPTGGEVSCISGQLTALTLTAKIINKDDVELKSK